VILLFPFTSFTPPALRRNRERGDRSGGQFDVQIRAQRNEELILDLATGDFGVLFRGCTCGLLGSSRVFLSDVDGNLSIENLEGSLNDNALQELNILGGRGKCRKLIPGCLEEVLQVLLAQVQEPQPGFVGQGGMSAENDSDLCRIGVGVASTYIFCATSAPLRLFSYCASIASCSCLTSFACEPEQTIGQSCPPFNRNDNLFDSELFIGLNLDFSGLLECLLLDERNLIV